MASDACWPEPAAEFTRRATSDSSRVRSEREANQRRADAARLAAERAREDDLENRYGEQVRNLSPQQRDELGEAAMGEAWRFTRRVESTAHKTLVAAMAKQHQAQAHSNGKPLATCT
jgi:hypothetical protein